ncbi:hypothetical protein AND_009939 [Anopheles darlingi]|uniref:Uncharacterized protein n=1 Tax=Anopheles darlingi TaxID=43151 RepID=W5J510_ANODA|nr:hypothetical protein AND_009939 [Anopheles darlingi]
MSIGGAAAMPPLGSYGKDRDDTVLDLVRGKRKRFRNTKHKRLAVSHSETNLSGLERGRARADVPAIVDSGHASLDIAVDEPKRSSKVRGSSSVKSGGRRKALQRQREISDGIRAPLWTTLTHAQTISDYEI